VGAGGVQSRLAHLRLNPLPGGKDVIGGVPMNELGHTSRTSTRNDTNRSRGREISFETN
jgi:hypothetical protein